MTTLSPRPIQKPRHLRPVPTLAAAVATALLAGCLGTAPSPAQGPRALVYGAVGSPIYEALRGKVNMTVSDGNQKVTDYDLVIVDGDAYTGRQLREEKPLHAAIRSGVWVLGLDVEEDDKKDGLGSSLNAATPGRSPGYLARQTRGAGGRQVNTFIDFAAHPGTAEQRAQQMVRFLTTRKVEALQGPATPPPPGLLTIDYRLIDPNAQLTMPANYNAAFKGQAQVATWQANHYVSVYLDNGTNPQGDFQHIVVETEGVANPNRLSVDNRDDASDHNGQSEVAYFQTRFQDSNSTVTSGGFEIQQSSPSNANNTTNVTTGLNFNIGFSGDGGNTSFGYSYSVTQNITDWAVTNRTTEGSAGWDFYSQNPFNGGQTSGFDASGWWYYTAGVVPQAPNALSLYDNEYNTISHWTNNAVYDGWVTVSGEDSGWYTDAWVILFADDEVPYDPDFAPHCVFPFDGCVCDNVGGCPTLVQHMIRHKVSKPWSLNVNAGAVIPVNLKSLTFSTNPVTAGPNASTTATLTLESQTPIDATVAITSDSRGVAPPYKDYTIPAGSDSLSVPIAVGPQGCQEQSATISATYANQVNAVLDVLPPPNCQ